MGFLDKILGAMKLNDDYDDDDFLDDDVDDYEDEGSHKSFFKKSRNDSIDDFDDDDDDLSVKHKVSKQPVKNIKTTGVKTKPSLTTSASKVSPIRSRKNSGDMAVCVVKPKSMEDAREITETLLANCTVVLNLEGLDLDLSQRIIDFTCGSCFAMSGNLQKISNYIYIITPASVDVSGDLQDILSGAFDVPSMNFRY